MFMPDGVGHRLHHSGDWSYHSPGDFDIYRAERIAIGIRLGQRWCSVSCIEDGNITDLMIKIPSLVTFTQNETYYGAEAIRHSISNINSSIYQFFGLLGKKYNDKSVQQFIKHVTYKIIKIDRIKHPQIPKYPLIDEDIGIPINFTGSASTKPHVFTVIEIVSQFLDYIMKESQDKIGCPIAHVAISIPNTFGQLQRLALLQAAKEVNIEPLRLVTSCMAASVYLTHCQIKIRKLEENNNKNETNHNHNDHEENKTANEYDYNNHPYIYDKNDKNINGYSSNNGYYKNGYYKNSTNNNHIDAKENKKSKKNKNKHKKRKKNKCYLIADLSNIACSISIIECKEKKHMNLIRVHYCAGNINYGIWKMVNAFSLYVIKSFVDGYCGYYRPNIHISNNKNKLKHTASKYDYKNNTFVYRQLEEIETIENNEDDDDDDEDEYKYNEEALKCRFRSQMLCDTIIEHLHDQYANEEVQIHYEKFYRSFSLQLILTTAKLYDIALNPFLFNIMNCIDKILQEYRQLKENIIDIDECILIGDGGNIPQVISLFNLFFNVNDTGDGNMKELYICRGCAIVIAVDQELLSSPISLDLLPHSIRMEDATTNNIENTLIIGAQNACPCKKTVTRYTYYNNQTTYKMKFYEGESNNNKLCRLIGVFKIINIKARPKRDTKIVIAVHIDRNCIMLVSAEDVSSKPPIQLNVIKLANN